MKKLLSYVLSMALLLLQVSPVMAKEAGTYKDEPASDHWSSGALAYAKENELLMGTGNGLLEPDGKLTRAQLASIISRMLELDEESDSKFVDVPANAWYAKDIAKVCKTGLMQGYSADKMLPNAEVTREQVAVILYRLLCLKSGEMAKVENFSDSKDVSSWAKAAVSAFVDNNYLQGSDGVLAPKKAISRAEFAKLFQNVFPNIVKNETDLKNLKEGNVLLKKSVDLANTQINGDLVFSKTVNPEVVLKSTSKISGRIVNPQIAKAVRADELKFTDKGVLANKELLLNGSTTEPKTPNPVVANQSTEGRRGGNTFVKADKDKLLEQLKKAEELNADPFTDEYKDEPLDKFTKEFAEAKKINENLYASQQEVDAKVESLKKSMEELVKSEKDKKVKFGKASANLPYEFRVKVVLNKPATSIVKVEDYGTNPLIFPDNDTKREDLTYLRSYWEKNGFNIYKGKDLDGVKALKLKEVGGYDPKGNDADAVSGATACSRAAKYAVINAMEKDVQLDKPVPLKKETLVQVYRGTSKELTGYTVRFENKLPKDYAVELESVCRGIFNGSDKIENVELSSDGTVLQIREDVKPGYYCLNIRDKSGKYPAFNTNGEAFDEYTYPFFVISPTEFENKVNIMYKEGRLSSDTIKLSDIFKNFKEIEIYKDSEKKENLIYAFPLADEVSDMRFKWINEFYKSNQIFDESGKVNPDYKRPDTGEKLFEDGKNYVIHAHLWNTGKGLTARYNTADANKYSNPLIKYFVKQHGRYGYISLKFTLSADLKTLENLEDAGSNIKKPEKRNWTNLMNNKAKFIGKTVEDINQIDAWGIEDIVKDAILEVIKQDKLNKNNTYAPKQNGVKKYGDEGYEITFKNSLPSDYKPRVKAIFYGTRGNCEEKNVRASIDYTGSVLRVYSPLSAGHYVLDIEDANGVFGAPMNKEEYGEETYTHFVIPAKDSDAKITFDKEYNLFKGENISGADILKNIWSIIVTNTETNDDKMIYLVENFGTLRDEFKNGNLPLKENGKINFEFTESGNKVFEIGKKYKVQLGVYGFETIQTGEFIAKDVDAPNPPVNPDPPQTQDEIEEVGKAEVPGFSYDLKVKLTMKDKKVVKIQDNGTAPANGSAGFFQIYKNGNGFDKFKGKTLQQVKAMSMKSASEDPNTDAISGATACSQAAQQAVINAMSLHYGMKNTQDAGKWNLLKMYAIRKEMAGLKK